MRLRILAAAACALVISALLGARDARADVEAANRLYDQAVNQHARASNLERRGKEEEAIEAYELAAQLCETSLAEAEQAGVPPVDRPPDVYYLCATSFLHASRLLTHLRREGRQKEENLDKAATYLDMVEKLESERAQRASRPLNPELWRVRNAAAYVSFLRGELAQARMHYESVLQMNPSYRPAEQAVAEINKLEQKENEMFTPQGRTLQKEKRRKVLRDVVDTLDLVRDIVTLGR